MKCEHECAEIVACTSFSDYIVQWCPTCGSLRKVKDDDWHNVKNTSYLWKSPTSQSGICPCGGYQVRAYDAALDSYRLVCEECGR